MQRVFRRFAVLLLGVLTLCASARAEEKLIQLDTTPQPGGRFNVAADGSRLYFAGQNGKYLVFDAQGALVDQFGVPNGSSPRNLMLLPDGWYISVVSYANGHVGLVRPDGTEAKVLVAKGSGEKLPHGDMTGWTSPTGGAIDVRNKRIFIIDTTMAPVDDRKIPTPDWSRIAMYDFDGNYLHDFNRYDAYIADRREKDGSRTWYRDIEVDPERQRLYALAIASSELLSFTYDGQLEGKVKVQFNSENGGVAVFPDGRIAVASYKTVSVFSPDLQLIRTVTMPPEMLGHRLEDVAVDAAGRMYVSSSNPGVTFARFAPDLDSFEVFGPRYLRVNVDFPQTTVVAGSPFELKASVAGRPQPAGNGEWQVLARPSDGSDLTWRKLPATYDDTTLRVTPPAELRGLYEVAVRYGNGPLDRANWRNDPFLEKTFAFVAPGATRSVTVLPANGRHAYQQGEAIAVTVVRRVPVTTPPVPATTPPVSLAPVAVKMELIAGGGALKTASINAGANYAAEVPGTVTRRLPPGRYLLRPAADGHESYGFAFDIVPAQPASPMQRIMYHEFGGNVLQSLNDLMDIAERKAQVYDWAAAAADMGFTRETMRDLPDPSAWRREAGPVDFSNPVLAPPEHYAAAQAGNWALEHYLDQATRFGLAYDGQLLGHCNAVRCSPASLKELDPILQRYAQWLQRYPSFYGFNYNDEMWVGGYNGLQSDTDWFKKLKDTDWKGKPEGQIKQHVTSVMYDSFNKAVREVMPRAGLTATPMWQFPAVEGSYPPMNYQGMSESYSHYLSEGYSLPWQPAHSVDILKRPNLPVMGVFDNLYNTSNAGNLYMKNVMQTMSRGAQGTGAEHTSPFEDESGADAYRTANRIAAMYGPIFASMPPANEAAVLYSYTQDFAQQRVMMGTPHWESVFALYGAGLMAGVPMEITFEEDIASGRLLDGKKPRVPMLFLTGQTKALPEAVQARVREFMAAGGKVFTDAASADFPGAVKLDIKPGEITPLEHQGYAADSAHPLSQGAYEKLAAALRATVGKYRRYPIDTDDPWVGKSRFNGWAIQYVALATETSPYPWDAGTVWSLGDMYCKGRNAFLPKTVQLGLPAAGGVVYDVFDHAVVKPAVSGRIQNLTVDLTTFPGRLYAVAPAVLGAPQLRATLVLDSLNWRAQIVDAQGKEIAGRVPLQVRLVNGSRVASESYVSSNVKGIATGALTVPVGGPWTLQVTELLGAKSSALTAGIGVPLMGALLQEREPVEMWRGEQINTLLAQAGQAGMTLFAGKGMLSEEQQTKLVEALKKRGIELRLEENKMDDTPVGVPLAIGSADGKLGDLLGKAVGRGLFPIPVTNNTPGSNRGFMTAVYAAREFGDNAIALVGGDKAGMDRVVDTFIAYLGGNWKPRASTAPPPSAPVAALVGKPAPAPPLARLRDEVGPQLAEVAVAADGRHVVVTAEGYLNNVALIEDTGTQGRVVKAARVGQALHINSPYVSADGSQFGAAGREIDRIGQGFHLLATTGSDAQVFADYGDLGRQSNRFAAAENGDYVIAPGTYGVVCWHKVGGKWAEAWSFDYWKEFNNFDWPVSSDAERVPQFHAAIPRGADYALVLFGETSPNGWITPENSSRVWLAAFNLADGKQRWRFDVPVVKTLMFPTLYTSPDGAKVLLQVQLGSWGKELYRYYSIVDGRSAASWESKTPASCIALANSSGRVAASFKGKLLEVRQPDGTLVFSVTWRRQPASLAFDRDGERLYVADDSGAVTLLDGGGHVVWRHDAGAVSNLAPARDGVYAAGWDGRLRLYSGSGRQVWSLDCTPALTLTNPMAKLAKAADLSQTIVHIPERPSTTEAKVPDGENMLRSGKATLTVGGTGGWMSEGKVQVKSDALVDGKTDDVETPWLHLDELFWDGQAGRQVWAEVTFKAPTDVSSLTVYENPKHPASWPTEGLVQVWDEAAKKWQTAVRSVFMKGAVNTYTLNKKGVTKLRYVPWNSYYRNFYTSEIEVH